MIWFDCICWVGIAGDTQWFFLNFFALLLLFIYFLNAKCYVCLLSSSLQHEVKMNTLAQGSASIVTFRESFVVEVRCCLCVVSAHSHVCINNLCEPNAFIYLSCVQRPMALWHCRLTKWIVAVVSLLSVFLSVKKIIFFFALPFISPASFFFAHYWFH